MGKDIFLKISSIPGQSRDDNHKGWIELLSFNHGVAQPINGAASAGPRPAGRSDHQDFTIVKALDKASPKLFLACCNGENIPEVVIEICGATGKKQKIIGYKLSNVMVRSVRPGGASQDDTNAPLEEVAFAYSKIEQEYVETDESGPKGSIKANWSVVENKGS